MALFVGVAAARFAILLVSQRHVHSDEAIIGLMAKHILEGRYFPFYMYGQAYNAGAAWEAYLAAAAFAFFGVGVLPLKACMVVLSLLCLFLFYCMCLKLYDQRTALLAAAVFALLPPLLKWHFQVRGYSWYFISIPLLTMLFAKIASDGNSKWQLFFLFGLVSGASIWCLELVAPLVAALWLLLVLRGRISIKNAGAGVSGFLAGYGAVVAWNLTHQFGNWRYLFLERPGGGLEFLLQLSRYGEIFLHEMPRFFGPDTVLWYYPDCPVSGYVFYVIALTAVAIGGWPFVRSPLKVFEALRGLETFRGQQQDFYMLALTLASFIPYLSIRPGVPSYFFGGCFFLSVLIGRMLARCFVCSNMIARVATKVFGVAIVLVGVSVMIKVGQKDQIETLTLCPDGKAYCMTRIPGADIESVQHYLQQHDVRSVWTTISFVYPLLFESGEKLAVSNAFFEDPYRVYPPSIPWREPGFGPKTAFVFETGAPFRPRLEMRLREAVGEALVIREYGALTVLAVAAVPPQTRAGDH